MLQGQFPQWLIANKRAATFLAVMAGMATSLPAQDRGHYEAPLGDGPWPVSVAVPHAPQPKALAGIVSVELLRYPLPGKARHMLQQALHFIDSGDHKAAIRQLQETLAKYPSSAPYTQSLLGVEYLKTDQIPEAVDSLQQAVDLLPHDAVNHTNLGLSLVSTGQFDRAKDELHRALELDPRNTTASRLLAALPPAHQ